MQILHIYRYCTFEGYCTWRRVLAPGTQLLGASVCESNSPCNLLVLGLKLHSLYPEGTGVNSPWMAWEESCHVASCPFPAFVDVLNCKKKSSRLSSVQASVLRRFRTTQWHTMWKCSPPHTCRMTRGLQYLAPRLSLPRKYSLWWAMFIVLVALLCQLRLLRS